MAHFILCKTCGTKKYINPAAGYIYCSRACREKDPDYARKLPQRQPHHRVTLTCGECGARYSRPYSIAYKHGLLRSKYCSLTCQHRSLTHLVGAKHPGWTGGYRGYYGANWIAQRKLARRRDGNRCVLCSRTRAQNRDRNMEVHHLIPFRAHDSYLDANVIENLVCLCIRCHRRQLRVNFGFFKERFACVLYGVGTQELRFQLPSVLSPLLLLAAS